MIGLRRGLWLLLLLKLLMLGLFGDSRRGLGEIVES